MKAILQEDETVLKHFFKETNPYTIQKIKIYVLNLFRKYYLNMSNST